MLLARNTATNFLGQVVSIVSGVIAIPFIMRWLGAERFGIFSLALVVMSYLSLLDLGLPRATVKFVAEALSTGEVNHLRAVVYTSLALHILLGTAGGVALAATTPLLVGHIFNIPPDLSGEARTTFFIFAASVPLVVSTACLRGILEAGQRFDLVNAVKVPSSCMMYLLPAAVLPFGVQLPGIVFLLLMVRIGAALAYLLLCIRTFPALRQVSLDTRAVRPLLSFGGWVFVSNVVASVLMYLDRFLIGSLLGMASVAYYATPYEILTKLLILPTSLVTVLFPVFSTLGTDSNKKGDAMNIGAQGVRFLLLIMGPLVFILVLFADRILALWLGTEFATKSVLVFRILAVGVLVNSLGWVPYSLLQGLGRPDVPTKLLFVETPILGGLMWLFIARLGITGAAVVWTMRVSLEVLCFFAALSRVEPSTLRVLVQDGLLRALVAVSSLALVALMVTKALHGALLVQVMVIAAVVAVFIFIAWLYVLHPSERKSLTSLVSRSS
jgi:O-antigen/teichoic acid export membrane protein